MEQLQNSSVVVEALAVGLSRSEALGMIVLAVNILPYTPRATWA